MSAEPNSAKGTGSTNEPGSPRGLIRRCGRHIMRPILTTVGAFLTIAGFVSYLSRETFRHWAQSHPYPISIALIINFLLTVPGVIYTLNLRERHRKLDQETRGRDIAREKSPEATTLLELLAFFAAEPVDENLLLQANVHAPTEELRRILTDPDRLRRAAVELSHMSLAEIDEPNRRIRVQRIAQAIARGQLSTENPAAARAVAKLVQSILAASDPGTPDRDDAEEIYRLSRRHLIASGAIMSSDPSVRQLVINQSRRLYRAGSYTEGVALGETSLSHWQETFGSDDRQTLELAVEVGFALRRLGRWEEAMELNLDTLRRLRLLFGFTDKVHLLCAASCGIDLALLGEYGKALKNNLTLLPSYERIFGCDHLDTLQVRNYIAINLRCIGRFEEALEYDRYTCSKRQEILGNEDMGTLTSRFAIARDLRMLGRIQEAHEILSDINLILARKLIVSQHFQLLVGADLAVSLRRCGRYQEALIQAEAVFRQYNIVFGPRHRDTLRTGINTTNDLRITGRLPDARKLGARTVAGWTAIVGANHPNTLAAQANLACVLRAEGNPAESLRINEYVVSRFTELFGEAHPSTLAVLTNLASDLAMMGEAHQARQIGEQSYQLHAETRGRDHPYTLATAANLALDRRGDRDHAGADELHASTRRICEGKLGTDHPESRLIAQYGRMTLDIEPMMD